MDGNDILQWLSAIGDRDGSWAAIAALVSDLDALPSAPDGIRWRERAAATVGYSSK
jgi:hypothetical protein